MIYPIRCNLRVLPHPVNTSCLSLFLQRSGAGVRGGCGRVPGGCCSLPELGHSPALPGAERAFGHFLALGALSGEGGDRSRERAEESKSSPEGCSSPHGGSCCIPARACLPGAAWLREAHAHPSTVIPDRKHPFRSRPHARHHRKSDFI